MLVEGAAAFGQKLDRLEHVVQDDRPIDIELEVPLRAGEGHRWSLPNTWTATMVKASHWVGLILPGMIEEPGSFSGIFSSPMPARGPLA